MSTRNSFFSFLFFQTFVGIIISCQSESQLYFARYYVAGKELYGKHCQNCHGTKGEGLGALVPPLTDSIYLTNNRTKLPCIIKHGLKGNVTVAGKEFKESMPASHQLGNIEIAEIITYVNNSFGNKLGLYDVEEVHRDLQECK